jgi:hypothetical protein
MSWVKAYLVGCISGGILLTTFCDVAPVLAGVVTEGNTTLQYDPAESLIKLEYEQPAPTKYGISTTFSERFFEKDLEGYLKAFDTMLVWSETAQQNNITDYEKAIGIWLTERRGWVDLSLTTDPSSRGKVVSGYTWTFRVRNGKPSLTSTYGLIGGLGRDSGSLYLEAVVAFPQILNRLPEAKSGNVDSLFQTPPELK